MTNTATKTIAALAIAVGTLATGTFATVSGAEAAIQTKPAISVAGKIHVNKRRAQSNAIKKWSAVARSRYGYKFGRWSTARGRSIRCKRIAVAWGCRATANPAANIKVCRGVVSTKSGKGFTAAEVRQRALKKWSKRVSKSYGASFASWGQASNRSLTCRTRSNGRIFCTASARPCK